MLHILNNLKNDLKFSLCCAHINHGLRGEAADSDEAFVKALCVNMGIDFYSKKFDVARLAEENKITCEEAGRNVRYSFFEEIKTRYGYNKVATAHNKNDNAETVLMRIIRGTGIDGLAGIPYIRNDGVIRPILDISREQVEEYCTENNLEFCTDATNLENDFTRNKVRNMLIPFIEREFNAKISDSLIRLSDSAEEDSKFLKSYTKRLYQRLGNPIPGSKLNTLHIDSLKLLEKPILTRVLQLAAEKSSPAKLEKKHICDIIELLNKNTGASINLPQGLVAEINYGWLTFSGPLDKIEVKSNADGFFADIAIGDTVCIEALGKEISIREENAKEYKCKINEIAADIDKIGFQPLFLRSRRDGDKIVWFSDGKAKKIKNIFIDEKIPQKDRNKIPLLATGDEIIAIVGSRVSEKYKITKDSERALVIRYGTSYEK
jgi:tRNA(Ile)-lysidine synthase